MDAFGEVVRQAVSDYVGSQHELSAVKEVLRVVNFCAVQSRGAGGTKIYAAGMKPELNLVPPSPSTSTDTLPLVPTKANGEDQHCPIEEVPGLELCFGGHVVGFEKASSVFGDGSAFNARFGDAFGDVILNRFVTIYKFDELLPPHGVSVEVWYGVRREVIAQRGLQLHAPLRGDFDTIEQFMLALDEYTASHRPERFSTSDLEGPVEFYVRFGRFPSVWEVHDSENEGAQATAGS